ncbi:alpha-L-glutamate ligase, RimK family [Methylocella silvestris BL2]|uniref:Alpha-L-glutamate ligase, RimK family n=1 Tax=Methylocella silvestris (strain DSM 15510 / CIP 108128 / LMG 27833 / NCIMB 13906 / BL2) TaxID=395965 RepID=B8EIJ9_METSB|nr:lysine biosynthesis protein LysX [Methylocella silvestris]ACK51318.1 alpha-L-glutamate ligase, RimK family [Methylocella silvestris BL2]
MPASPKAALLGEGAPKIAIAVDLYDWHARDLTAAFARAGALATPIRLAQCGFDTQRKHGLVIHGFGSDLPDAVFVRAIGSGSFESVTLRLSVLHALRDLGVPVANPARAVEICVDKAATSFALAHAKIPTPPTWAAQSTDAARKILRREISRGPLVLKPLFGAQGFGLRLIQSEDDLPPIEAVEYVYYLQRFIGPRKDVYSDMRFFVSDGKVIGAMIRRAANWITNIKLGARPEWLEPDDALTALALRASSAVGAQFAGVDIILDADGAPQVLEVNSMPGWRGLQKVAPFCVADRLVRDFLKHAGRAPVEEAPTSSVERVA